MIRVTIPNYPGFADAFQRGMAIGNQWIPSPEQQAQTKLTQAQTKYLPQELKEKMAILHAQAQMARQKSLQQQMQSQVLQSVFSGGTSPGQQPGQSQFQNRSNDLTNKLAALHGQMGSPEGQMGSPEGQMGLPGGQMGLPGGQMGSPGGQMGSLGGQMGSPGGQIRTPFGSPLQGQQQAVQPPGGLQSLLSQKDKPNLFGVMSHLSPQKQQIVSKMTGLKTATDMVKDMGPNARNVFLSNANDRELNAMGYQSDKSADDIRRAAAVRYAKENLLPESQNILSGTRTFTGLYNKDIVPQVNKLFRLVDASGAKGAGIFTIAKIKSLMSGNNEINKTRVALLNSLKDLSGSYRQAGGDRATIGQIQLNIDQLTDQIKHGNLTEASETLNQLSQLVYDKGQTIVDTDLSPVKSSYPKFKKPEKLHFGEMPMNLGAHHSGRLRALGIGKS